MRKRDYPDGTFRGGKVCRGNWGGG